ncbi:MAG: CDP-alcohol phosphatidyltransferase family protein [Bacteroidaceae bacterium]|nr:CDP-alcohol phosphatidyltransferase family protein [Bacteroidaceae bacterium]
MSLIDNVRATLKSQDTEGPFELYMTRTPGYLWACLFKWLGVHPVAVTLMSIVIGAASGWFFYSEDLGMNLIGMGLLVWANWYDCADGQLARMTGKRTLIGRILDGFCGDVWFFFIYLFLCLRMQGENIPFTNVQWGIWIWLLGAWAGLRCHGRQCAIGDYYRNIHLYFLLGAGRAELDSEAKIKEEMNSMKWMSKDWFHKLYLYFYARYTGSQEAQVKSFHTMMKGLEAKYGTEIPLDVREDFCRESRPQMPLTNIITFDTRVIVLFLCIGFGIPWLYFIFESTVLEAIRFHMIERHERLCERITAQYTQN